MRILGIETSCDETAAAVIEGNPQNKTTSLLSNTVSSSLTLHAKTGGIIPEVAARQQIKYILPVIQKALADSNSTQANIDALAVTIGPGLIGSLLVGVETAKTLAYAWNKPIIPVNHLIAHLYANFIELDSRRYSLNANREFPALGLIVSGGHTDLILMKKHGSIMWLGGTRDDAAGEALDKIGRLIGLPYPAGPIIEKLAKDGNSKKFLFPRPMIDSGDYDFSFSGLKTAVLREVKTMKQLNNETTADISFGVQQAIVDVLVTKTLKAARQFKVKSILLGGGVAANQTLRTDLELNARRSKLDAEIFFPEKWLCTDNAAVIATTALFNYKPVPWQKITADPELYFD